MTIRAQVIGDATLRAPFPWFGGKSTIAADVWARLGDCPNFVEPFFGSGAVLLSRPHAPHTETVNDKDALLANFWRAVQADPDAVAHHADWPVNEADLHARHYWLVTEGAARVARLQGDPLGYDAQVAGWWVWGACAWIGSGWCSGKGPWRWTGEEWVRSSDGPRVNHKIPHVGNAGRGLHRPERAAFIGEWIAALSARLRHVRVACGDWTRVLGPSVTTSHGLTAVFLDPPYGDSGDGRATVYAQDDLTVAAAARQWAVENGDDPLLRIAFAGYDGEHEYPPGWQAVRWKAKGGYGSQGDGRGRDNATRETVWFSPHCIRPEATRTLFDMLAGDAA